MVNRKWLENYAASVVVAGVRIATEACPICGEATDKYGDSVTCPKCGGRVVAAVSAAKEAAKEAAVAGLGTFLDKLLK